MCTVLRQSKGTENHRLLQNQLVTPAPKKQKDSAQEILFQITDQLDIQKMINVEIKISMVQSIMP